MSKSKKINPNVGNSRIRSILSRVKVVASDGVKFDYYEDWEGNFLTDQKNLALITNEAELRELEIKLDN